MYLRNFGGPIDLTSFCDQSRVLCAYDAPCDATGFCVYLFPKTNEQTKSNMKRVSFSRGQSKMRVKFETLRVTTCENITACPTGWLFRIRQQNQKHMKSSSRVVVARSYHVVTSFSATCRLFIDFTRYSTQPVRQIYKPLLLDLTRVPQLRARSVLYPRCQKDLTPPATPPT